MSQITNYSCKRNTGQDGDYIKLFIVLKPSLLAQGKE